jgi:hypothetical protein
MPPERPRFGTGPARDRGGSRITAAVVVLDLVQVGDMGDTGDITNALVRGGGHGGHGGHRPTDENEAGGGFVLFKERERDTNLYIGHFPSPASEGGGHDVPHVPHP